MNELEEVYLNGYLNDCLGYVFNLVFWFVDVEVFMVIFNWDIVVLVGLVCILVDFFFFYVLIVMGKGKIGVEFLIWFSFGCFN